MEIDRDEIYFRYQNRKLYHVKTARYVTLPDLLRKIKEGKNITVFCRVKNEDVTDFVLTQALVSDFYKNKKSIRLEPRAFLRVIEAGGLGPFLEKLFKDQGYQGFQRKPIDDETKEFVKRFLKTKKDIFSPKVINLNKTLLPVGDGNS